MTPRCARAPATAQRPGRGPARAAWLALALLLLVVAGCDLECPGADRPIRVALRADLARPILKRPRHAYVEPADLAPLVERFYTARQDRPAWVDARGALPRARALLSALEGMGEWQLDPADLGVTRIEHLLALVDPVLHGKHPDPARLAELDVALTRAWLTCARQLHGGRADPRQVWPEWHLAPAPVDFTQALDEVVDDGDPVARLVALDHARPASSSLRAALARYRAAADRGDWPEIPDGPRLLPGHADPRVPLLRRRLAAEGELDATSETGATFDRPLVTAMRRFQLRHGLAANGVVGAGDVAALNVPAVERVRQIELNLERMRWLPDTAAAPVVRVNVPEYILRVVEPGHPTLTSRVVVGKDSTRTPLFDASLKLMVVNPFWRIPPHIAGSEILDQIRKDPGYLARNNIRVMDGAGPGAREVDPRKVRWNELTAEKFRYRLLQDPGPENAVGHVKFMCPNPYSIYLHDTPAVTLFSATTRAFSHGCVRVEKPLDLAERLLEGKEGWDRGHIAAAFDSSRNEVVFLPAPVPVRITYFTAWVDSAGRTQFRDDVYGFDRRLAMALRREKLPRLIVPPSADSTRTAALTGASAPTSPASHRR